MRLRSSLHATNLILLAGVATLAAVAWMPYGTGARVARVEARARDTVVALLACAEQTPGLLLDGDAAAVAALEQRLAARWEELGLPLSARPELVPESRGSDVLRFITRHFAFQLARTPPSATQLEIPERGSWPLEAWAWPMALTSPGRSTFYARQGQPLMYSRNLVARYMGFERPPQPGGARERSDASAGYWGVDGERWMFEPS